MKSYRRLGWPKPRVIAWLMTLGVALFCGATAQAAPQYDLDCVACHTMPPLDSVSGQRVPGTGATKGNHQRHADSTAVSCSKCHGAAALSYATGHRTKAIEVSQNINGSATGTYSRGFFNQTSVPPVPLGTCSNVNCHFEQTSPAWGSPLLVNVTDCNQCHGASPSAGHPTGGSKHGIYYGTGTGSCLKCHPDHTAEAKPFAHATSVTSRGISVRFTAAPNSGGSYSGPTNDFLPSQSNSFGTCSGIYCHSDGRSLTGPYTVTTAPNWGGATLGCNGCHGGPAALGSSILATGKHQAHINNSATLGTNYGCADCHAKTASNDTTVSTVANHVNAFLDYSGVRAGRSSTYGAGSCSATYCHTSGKKGKAGMVGTVEPGAPSWSGAALGCSGCHGAQVTPTAGVAFNSVAGEPNYVSGAAGAANANSHQKHVAAAGAATCANCHSKSTTTGTTIIAGSQHTDGFINYTAGNGKSFGRGTGKTCSNVSCHGGSGIVAAVADAQWGATLDCNGCHGGPAALGTNILVSGKHTQHVNQAGVIGDNLGCADCHAKTVSSNSTISDSAKHLNAFLDYSGVKAGGSSSYSTGTGICSASYCHSSGKKGQSGMVATVEPANPSWSGAALNCKGCHGAQVTPTAGVAFNSVAGEPNYTNGGSGANNANSHQKHVKTDGATTCVYCHSTTVDATGIVIVGNHTNKAVNVASGGGKTFGYPGSKTCSSVSCHSGAAFSAANAIWGSSLDCKGCHATLSGAHTRHVGTTWNTLPFYNYTANLSSGADTDGVTWRNYSFGCANCPPVTLASHQNGSVEVQNGQVAGGSFLRNKNTASGLIGTVGAGTLRCSNVYCHANVTTPQWNQTFTVATRCGGCHGNAPASDSHAAHKVGIHYDGIFSGTTGLLPASGAVGVNAGHGDPAQSTTIGCNVCHYNTVTAARNKYNSSCSTASCHGNVTGNNTDALGAARIASLAFHVNGTNNVAFVPATIIKSKAQMTATAFVAYTSGLGGWSSTSRIYKNGTATSFDRSKNNLTVGSYVGGNCSNISCHNGKTANWTTDFGGAQDCVMCHKKP